MEQSLPTNLNRHNSTTQNKNQGHPMQLPSRKQTHIARKIWHIVGVGIFTYLYYILPYNVSLGLVSGFSILLIGLDFLRFKVPWFKNAVTKLMCLFIRKEELDKPTGLSYMCFGFWLLILLFEREVAILTLLFVMLGDPFAAYIGIKYGKDKIGDKTVQGFLACFAICAVVAFVFLKLNDFNSSRLVYVSLLSALIASGAELVQINKVDDNLSMPVISGFLLTLLFSLTA